MEINNKPNKKKNIMTEYMINQTALMLKGDIQEYMKENGTDKDMEVLLNALTKYCKAKGVSYE